MGKTYSLWKLPLWSTMQRWLYFSLSFQYFSVLADISQLLLVLLSQCWYFSMLFYTFLSPSKKFLSGHHWIFWFQYIIMSFKLHIALQRVQYSINICYISTMEPNHIGIQFYPNNRAKVSSQMNLTSRGFALLLK